MSRSQMRGYPGHHHHHSSHNHNHHHHRHHHHHSGHADPRTPMAWRHRDMNFQSSGRGHRPPSPSVASSSTDEQDDVPMVRHPPQRPRSRENLRSGGGDRFYNGHSQFTALPMDAYPLGPPVNTGSYRNGGGGGGTLRSTRSVPALALATWDGEPCPVHGHGLPVHTHPVGAANGTLRRHGSMFDVRGPYFPPPHMMMAPPPPPSSILDKKSFHGSMQMLSPVGPPPPPPFPMGPSVPIPHHLLPPMMRPRQMVIPAGAEPLPVRDPFKIRTPPPGYGSKEEDPYSVDQVCCKGHLIVLWIILAVVTVGVILGIILGVTIA